MPVIRFLHDPERFRMARQCNSKPRNRDEERNLARRDHNKRRSLRCAA